VVGAGVAFAAFARAIERFFMVKQRSSAWSTFSSIWVVFSWANLQSNGLYNQIPRSGGNFYWRQAYNAVRSGCTMIYGAMFDEVDEGTAMYKLAPTAAHLPAQGTFVPLNADGYNLGSDWYLRLADQAGRMLRGEIPVTSTIPITPP
jgi:hypothetical protein